MKTISILESKLSKLISLLKEDVSNTIYLQLINGYFYPTNSVSRDIMANRYNIGRIPENKFYMWSPKLVRDGYKLAIDGYNDNVNIAKDDFKPNWPKIGGEPHSVKNPCDKCKLNGICDSDDCGNKK